MVIKKMLLLLFLSSVMLSGCVSTQVKKDESKKVALVLGGGGARGFAHVGVIRELEAENIPIDMIVGVSVGSLIGALYADTKDSFQLEWTSFKIKKEEIFDFKLLNISNGLAKGDAMETYIDKNIHVRYLEDLKIPIAIVAADLKTGEPVIFQKGLIKDAIRASTSVPGVFEPVAYGDRLLVDGGVLGNLAPQVAKDLGADIIIGVNIAKSRTDFTKTKPNALTVILESIGIMGDEIVRCKKDEFDVLIEPDVGDVGITDFTKKKQLINAGRNATIKVLDRIKKLTSELNKRR